MDNSGLGGGFLSGPNGGLLDLESSIPGHQQSQFGHSSLNNQHQISLLGDIGDDHQPTSLLEVKGSSSKEFGMSFGKEKSVSHINLVSDSNMSDEDEPSFAEEENGENYNEGKGKKGSPWQRMKWTDDVVRLLILVVSSVGDDGTLDNAEGHKRKPGILQKKGKWKTVSKIMISKGCQVSPQQCEDKFNDLNKRYKRLNDILGRSVTCRVVENPALLDSISHLSAKAKDDVRKILSSKHLFYKEMCAYHNSNRIPNCKDIDLPGCSGRCLKDNNTLGEEEVDRTDDTDDESDHEDIHNDDGGGVGERMIELSERKGCEENGQFCSQSSGMDGFEAEMAKILHDPSKSPGERREWIKKQMLQLQDQRVSLQSQAFELEKQRLKWLRYCSKKDRELERLRLENERLRLDNERMILHIRQKELGIDFRMSEASLDPTSLGSRQRE